MTTAGAAAHVRGVVAPGATPEHPENPVLTHSATLPSMSCTPQGLSPAGDLLPTGQVRCLPQPVGPLIPRHGTIIEHRSRRSTPSPANERLLEVGCQILTDSGCRRHPVAGDVLHAPRTHHPAEVDGPVSRSSIPLTTSTISPSARAAGCAATASRIRPRRPAPRHTLPTPSCWPGSSPTSDCQPRLSPQTPAYHDMAGMPLLPGSIPPGIKSPQFDLPMLRSC